MGMSAEAAPALDDREQLEWTRRKLEHENDLVNHRLSWLASSQAFLAAAYVIRFSSDSDTPEGLERGIPVLGIVSTLVVFSSIIAAVWAFQVEQRRWTRDEEQRERVLLTGTPLTQKLGFIAPIGLPVVVVAGWLAALSYELG
jgi:hypothetical protein